MLEAQLPATVSDAALARLRAMMPESGVIREDWGRLQVRRGEPLLIDIDGNDLIFRFRTSCLDPQDHPEVERTLRRTLAPIVYDLTQR